MSSNAILSSYCRLLFTQLYMHSRKYIKKLFRKGEGGIEGKMEKRYIYIRIHIYYKNVNTHAHIWYTCAHVTLNRTRG